MVPTNSMLSISISYTYKNEVNEMNIHQTFYMYLLFIHIAF